MLHVSKKNEILCIVYIKLCKNKLCFTVFQKYVWGMIIDNHCLHDRRKYNPKKSRNLGEWCSFPTDSTILKNLKLTFFQFDFLLSLTQVKTLSVIPSQAPIVNWLYHNFFFLLTLLKCLTRAFEFSRFFILETSACASETVVCKFYYLFQSFAVEKNRCCV